ncbi:serine/threonine protein kinase [Streptomyces collinus]|uniref:Serine/threonine-protein kinase n=1 Tax=Streptomyces collinus TaxID=42684 RepID=A0AA89PY91_STRCU|nr:serine/threonine protein kinase [Streptomyces collinus]MBB5811291.1 serine/threonine-protein kinase [Streptomyces collinus]WMX64529.1 serine/threonine protein kinase [Streptomyces collinus]
MTHHPLLDATEVPATEPYLRTVGAVFRAFREQDSGCVSYGVRLANGERWFVKEATTAAARRSLARAWTFHRAVRHPAVVPQLHRFAVRSGGPAVVMPWCPGEILHHPALHRHGGRAHPAHPLARFRAQPVTPVLRAVDRLLDAHLAVEAAGFVAVDLYDGAFLYDFDAGDLRLIDLDEYRPGPFTLEADRLPGSRRFMAPEEWRRGSRIDGRTTVHALGRAIRLLLDAGDEERAWRGTAEQLAVVDRAVRPDPAERFTGVGELAAAWRRSVR